MKAESKKNVIFAVLFWALFAALWVYLVVQAAMPAEQSSQESGRITAAIGFVLNRIFPDPEGLNRPITERWPWFSGFVRKAIGHFGAFGLLGVFATLALWFTTEKKTRYPISLAIGVFTAALTECVQLFADGRAGMFSDVLLDSAGYLLGGVITVLFAILIGTKKKKREKGGKV